MARDTVLVQLETQFLAGGTIWDTVIGTGAKRCAVDFELADVACSTSNTVNRTSNL